MEEKQLKEILEKHQKMLNNEAGGELANLSTADLSGANLSNTTIYYTKF